MRHFVLALAVIAVVASTLPVGVSAQAGEPVDCTSPVALTDATGEMVTS
jgi:hypothetical protein